MSQSIAADLKEQTNATPTLPPKSAAKMKPLVVNSDVNNKINDRFEQRLLQSGSATQEMRLEDEENPGSYSTRYVYIKNGDICVTVFRETAV